MVRQPQLNGLGSAQSSAGQAQPLTCKTRATAQKIAATDIRKQANSGFRHGQFAARCDQPVTRTLAQPHATAHNHTIHESQHWLGEAVNQVVEGVFLGKKVFWCRVARQQGLVEKADVAASAKSAKRPRLVAATHGNNLDAFIVTPGLQADRQGPNHGQRERVKGLRPVQANEPHLTTNFAKHIHRGVVHARSLHPTSSLATRAPMTKAPPKNTSWPGTSPAPSQASKMPKMTSSKPSSATSGAFRTRAHTTTSRQGIANWPKPRPNN